MEVDRSPRQAKLRMGRLYICKRNKKWGGALGGGMSDKAVNSECIRPAQVTVMWKSIVYYCKLKNGECYG